MSSNLSFGLMLGVISGVFLGSFALPMKKVKIWQWENIWILYSLWATFILPFILAVFTIPNLFDVYSSVSFSVLALVFFFGACWGVANVCFGLGLKLMGLALGTAIILGMNNALGSILPIILYYPENLFKPSGLGLIVGVATMILGIVVCSVAGARRERLMKTGGDRSGFSSKSSFIKGLTVCLIAGVFGAMFNFALIAGKPLETQSLANGATTLSAVNATWCVSLLGGFTITLIYVLCLFYRNKSFSLFQRSATGINWLWTFLMGLLWYSGVAIYGMAVMNLGDLGASIGWPVIQSMAVVSGNIWGIVTGEWKGSGKQALPLMIVGLLTLIIGIAIIGWSSRL